MGGPKSKLPAFITSYLQEMLLTDFQNACTGALNSKFAITWSTKIAAHLKRFSARDSAVIVSRFFPRFFYRGREILLIT